MQIYSENSIDNLLSSNKTYDEKINILRKQQECTQNINDAIDEKIDKFEKGQYLEPMYKERIRNLTALKNWLITLSVTGLISGVEIANYQKIEELLSNSETAEKGMILFFTGIFSSALCVTSLSESIRTSYNEKLFKQGISSYQRRLK